ncbi:AAA family ATPase [Streptomyces sp. NPDC056944]|uniref:AAA family ATPase n=1 Tax=Streptomyces sp. NPDC056944 TaxID=3345972 RepID=UPI00363840D0
MDSHGESLFVGRAALLTSLCRQVDAAAVGQGGLVLLAGEPGIGKTALAAEVLGYARSLGATVAWGSCEDGGTAPGLWPWQQILRSATVRPEPLGDGDGTPARAGGEDTRPAFFERVAERLLEGDRPLVAVLDDLQWADTASVLLLGHLGRRSDHHPALGAAQERFTRPAYVHGLIAEWIPAVDGIVPKLEAGATVADLGCGRGLSSILIAQRWPNARVTGFDPDDAAVAHARSAAAEAGMDGRVSFEVAEAATYPGDGYDLVTFTDSLHDTGDPQEAAAHAQPGAVALGTMAGESRLRDVLTAAGLTRIRRIAQDSAPLHIILEARS